jgi:hypothetical protein
MKKKYQFAFFGLSGSGKTCLLAALDMQRIEHPGGYTSSRLPVDVKRPIGDIWTDADKEAELLHKSNDRLEEAKQQLEEGTVPNGTELNIDFIFDYKFSSQVTGDFHARLIDYSGELIHSQNAHQDIAKELRKKLEKMDGLLILAPAPLNQQAVSEKLNQLQKTIGLIGFRKPIALLITKWDRISPLSEYTVTQHALTPEQLPTTEHRDLYHDLINKVGKENCKAFAVSAFGSCEMRTSIDGKTTEFPKQINPLASFGLLEGFIWLAQRLEILKSQENALQLQNYEQTVSDYKKWLPYPSVSLFKLKRQIKTLTKVFPKDSEMAKRAKHAQRKISRVWWTRLMLLIALTLLIPFSIVLGLQTHNDKKNFDLVQRSLNNPNADLNEIKKAEQWLETYYYTTPLYHPFSWLLVVSNSAAKDILLESRLRREHQFWGAIQDAPSIEKKLEAANAYLNSVPNGERITEARKIAQQAEESLRKKREQQWWQALQQAPSMITKREAARAYLKALPNGEHQAKVQSILAQIEEHLRNEKEQNLWQQIEKADQELVKLKIALAYQKAFPAGKYQARIKNIITQIEENLRQAEEEKLWQPVLKATSPRTRKEAASLYLQSKPQGQYAAQAKLIIAEANETLNKEWEQFTNQYYELIKENQFLEAAIHLSQRDYKDKALESLKTQFLENVFKSITTQINWFIEQGRWSDAYDELDKYGNWPEEFRTEPGDEIIRRLRKKTQIAHDQRLYAEFLANKDIERARNYLSSAPLQTMHKQVVAYKKYLIDIENPLELTLILERIKWGNFADNDNIITVYMNEEKIIEMTGVNALANGSTGKIGSYRFTKLLNDVVTIKVEIIEKNWFTDYDNNGEGYYNGKIEDLKHGKTLLLRPPKGEFVNKAVFRLEGIPSTPNLPDWRK